MLTLRLTSTTVQSAEKRVIAPACIPDARSLSRHAFGRELHGAPACHEDSRQVALPAFTRSKRFRAYRSLAVLTVLVSKSPPGEKARSPCGGSGGRRFRPVDEDHEDQGRGDFEDRSRHHGWKCFRVALRHRGRVPGPVRLGRWGLASPPAYLSSPQGFSLRSDTRTFSSSRRRSPVRGSGAWTAPSLDQISMPPRTARGGEALLESTRPAEGGS